MRKWLCESSQLLESSLILNIIRNIFLLLLHIKALGALAVHLEEHDESKLSPSAAAHVHFHPQALYCMSSPLALHPCLSCPSPAVTIIIMQKCQPKKISWELQFLPQHEWVDMMGGIFTANDDNGSITEVELQKRHDESRNYTVHVVKIQCLPFSKLM